MSASLIQPTATNQAIEWKWLALPALLYILLIALTHPPFIGDTPLYAGELAAASGISTPALWEFGHILWRPLGFLLSPLFLSAIPDSIAWTPVLKISYGLICLTVVSGLICTVLIYDLSRRFISRPILAMVPVLIFLFGDSFLSYSQSGVSYVPALAALLGGLWVQLTAPRVDWKTLGVSACLYGLACLFWFPFVFVLPAAACARTLSGLHKEDRWSWMHILSTLVIASVVLTAGVSFAALMAGVHSIATFRVWMSASSHEWHQNRQWVRAISGCPRLLIDLGRDGIYLKRFTFHDPYNPVSAAAIVRLTLWKIGFFYVFVVSLAALAWSSPRSRPVLALAALAGLPLLLFAVLLFEPSSPERFMPALPFLLLALAAGWTSPAPLAKWLRAIIWVFIVALPVMNWPSFAGSFSEESRRTHARLDDIRKVAGPEDVLVTVNLQDPVIQLIGQNLFDPANRPMPFRSRWLVNVAGEKVALWRQDFATAVLQNWRENREVWVTKDALAGSPQENSSWVEGDNPVLHWKDIESFFNTLEWDEKTSRPDGFVRLHRSPQMQDRFARLSNGEAPSQP